MPYSDWVRLSPPSRLYVSCRPHRRFQIQKEDPYGALPRTPLLHSIQPSEFLKAASPRNCCSRFGDLSLRGVWRRDCCEQRPAPATAEPPPAFPTAWQDPMAAHCLCGTEVIPAAADLKLAKFRSGPSLDLVISCAGHVRGSDHFCDRETSDRHAHTPRKCDALALLVLV